MNQLLVPALSLLAVSSTLLAVFCVYGYRSLKKQIEQLVLEGAKVALLSESLIETAKQLDGFCSRAKQPERHENLQPDAPAPPPPVSPNGCGQLMRLHQSGKPVSSIASALGVSQGEVKLMVKLQELLSENGREENSPNFL